MQADLVDGELQLAPGFAAPPNTDYVGYHNYVDEMMPPETPYLYGLHPNGMVFEILPFSHALMSFDFTISS